MVRELVFHLGDRKTGSTSIQKALATKAWDCPTVALHYPATATHIPLAKSLTEPAQMPKRDERFRRLVRQIERAEADVAVISAEHFESVPPPVLKEAIATYLPAYKDAVRLIAYVRPHADRVVSSYTQQIKMGLFADDLDAFHRRTKKNRRFYYADRFAAWRAHFGDRFTLRPMIRDRLAGGSVVQDFFDYVLDGAPFTLTEKASNESLCLEDLALLRELHLAVRGAGKHAKLQDALGGRLAQILLAAKPRSQETKPRLHARLVPKIRRSYAADARALDRSFFDDAPMTAALEAAGTKVVEAPQSVRIEDHYTADEVRALRAWCAPLAEIVAVEPDLQRQNLARRRIGTLISA